MTSIDLLNGTFATSEEVMHGIWNYSGSKVTDSSVLKTCPVTEQSRQRKCEEPLAAALRNDFNLNFSASSFTCAQFRRFLRCGTPAVCITHRALILQRIFASLCVKETEAFDSRRRTMNCLESVHGTSEYRICALSSRRFGSALSKLLQQGSSLEHSTTICDSAKRMLNCLRPTVLSSCDISFEEFTSEFHGVLLASTMDDCILYPSKDGQIAYRNCSEDDTAEQDCIAAFSLQLDPISIVKTPRDLENLCRLFQYHSDCLLQPLCTDFGIRLRKVFNQICIDRRSDYEEISGCLKLLKEKQICRTKSFSMLEIQDYNIGFKEISQCLELKINASCGNEFGDLVLEIVNDFQNILKQDPIVEPLMDENQIENLLLIDDKDNYLDLEGSGEKDFKEFLQSPDKNCNQSCYEDLEQILSPMFGVSPTIYMEDTCKIFQDYFDCMDQENSCETHQGLENVYQFVCGNGRILFEQRAACLKEFLSLEGVENCLNNTDNKRWFFLEPSEFCEEAQTLLQCLLPLSFDVECPGIGSPYEMIFAVQIAFSEGFQQSCSLALPVHSNEQFEFLPSFVEFKRRGPSGLFPHSSSIRRRSTPNGSPTDYRRSSPAPPPPEYIEDKSNRKSSPAPPPPGYLDPDLPPEPNGYTSNELGAVSNNENHCTSQEVETADQCVEKLIDAWTPIFVIVDPDGLDLLCAEFSEMENCIRPVYNCASNISKAMMAVFKAACQTKKSFQADVACLKTSFQNPKILDCLEQTGLILSGTGTILSIDQLPLGSTESCQNVASMLSCSQPILMEECSPDFLRIIVDFHSQFLKEISPECGLTQIRRGSFCTVGDAKKIERCDQPVLEFITELGESAPAIEDVTPELFGLICQTLREYEQCLSEIMCQSSLVRSLYQVFGRSCSVDTSARAEFGTCLQRIKDQENILSCTDLIPSGFAIRELSNLRTLKGTEALLTVTCFEVPKLLSCLEPIIKEECGDPIWLLFIDSYHFLSSALGLPCAGQKCNKEMKEDKQKCIGELKKGGDTCSAYFQYEFCNSEILCHTVESEMVSSFFRLVCEESPEEFKAYNDCLATKVSLKNCTVPLSSLFSANCENFETIDVCLNEAIANDCGPKIASFAQNIRNRVSSMLDSSCRSVKMPGFALLPPTIPILNSQTTPRSPGISPKKPTSSPRQSPSIEPESPGRGPIEIEALIKAVDEGFSSMAPSFFPDKPSTLESMPSIKPNQPGTSGLENIPTLKPNQPGSDPSETGKSQTMPSLKPNHPGSNPEETEDSQTIPSIEPNQPGSTPKGNSEVIPSFKPNQPGSNQEKQNTVPSLKPNQPGTSPQTIPSILPVGPGSNPNSVPPTNEAPTFAPEKPGITLRPGVTLPNIGPPGLTVPPGVPIPKPITKSPDYPRPPSKTTNGYPVTTTKPVSPGYLAPKIPTAPGYPIPTTPLSSPPPNEVYPIPPPSTEVKAPPSAPGSSTRKPTEEIINGYDIVSPAPPAPPSEDFLTTNQAPLVLTSPGSVPNSPSNTIFLPSENECSKQQTLELESCNLQLHNSLQILVGQAPTLTDFSSVDNELLCRELTKKEKCVAKVDCPTVNPPPSLFEELYLRACDIVVEITLAERLTSCYARLDFNPNFGECLVLLPDTYTPNDFVQGATGNVDEEDFFCNYFDQFMSCLEPVITTSCSIEVWIFIESVYADHKNYLTLNCSTDFNGLQDESCSLYELKTINKCNAQVETYLGRLTNESFLTLTDTALSDLCSRISTHQDCIRKMSCSKPSTSLFLHLFARACEADINLTKTVTRCLADAEPTIGFQACVAVLPESYSADDFILGRTGNFTSYDFFCNYFDNFMGCLQPVLVENCGVDISNFFVDSYDFYKTSEEISCSSNKMSNALKKCEASELAVEENCNSKLRFFIGRLFQQVSQFSRLSKGDVDRVCSEILSHQGCIRTIGCANSQFTTIIQSSSVRSCALDINLSLNVRSCFDEIEANPRLIECQNLLGESNITDVVVCGQFDMFFNCLESSFQDQCEPRVWPFLRDFYDYVKRVASIECIEETTSETLDTTSAPLTTLEAIIVNFLPLNTSDNEITSGCTKARDDAKAAGERRIPQCQEDGRYQPLQCDISTGTCWCTNVDTGAELPGSRVGPGKRLPTCGIREVFSCERLAWKETCRSTGKASQPVFRWFKDGNTCRPYRYAYCLEEAHVAPYPFKRKRDCESICLNQP